MGHCFFMEPSWVLHILPFPTLQKTLFSLSLRHTLQNRVKAQKLNKCFIEVEHYLCYLITCNTQEMYHLTTSYYHGILEWPHYEEIFVEIPLGFSGLDSEGKVCKLLWALYGLKHAPQAWYSRIDSYLVTQGLTKSYVDPNLDYSITNRTYTIVLLYVNDILVTFDNYVDIHYITSHIHSNFDTPNVWVAYLYLGCNIEYHLNGIWLHQQRYIKSFFIKFNMKTCSWTPTLMCFALQLQTNMGDTWVDKQHYQSLVGALIYAIVPCVDIVCCVGCVSCYYQSHKFIIFVLSK